MRAVGGQFVKDFRTAGRKHDGVDALVTAPVRGQAPNVLHPRRYGPVFRLDARQLADLLGPQDGSSHRHDQFSQLDARQEVLGVGMGRGLESPLRDEVAAHAKLGRKRALDPAHTA